jgi:hypothetical protein
MIISSELAEVISDVKRDRVKTGILIILEDKTDQQDHKQVEQIKGATKLRLLLKSLCCTSSNYESTIHNSDFFFPNTLLSVDQGDN